MRYPSTLNKNERICSRKLIESLFRGGRSHSISAFPLRAVYMLMETEAQEAKISDDYAPSTTTPLPQSKQLISVPKRFQKHAVKRNLVKRQVREAYRKNKSIIADWPVAIAFIWLDTQILSYDKVERKIKSLLFRLKERLEAQQSKDDG